MYWMFYEMLVIGSSGQLINVSTLEYNNEQLLSGFSYVKSFDGIEPNYELWTRKNNWNYQLPA